MSITAPFLDTEETWGAGIAGLYPDVIAPFLDTTIGFGPIVTPDPASLPLQILVDGEPLAITRRREFKATRDSAGSFSFEIPRDVYLANPTPDFDDKVVFLQDGKAIFAGIVETIDHDAVVPGEGAAESVTIGGRGSLAIFAGAPVFPSRGVEALPIEDVRSFSWVGPDFDDSAWPFAKQINRQREYANWRSPLPWIWPDTTGYWIWANQSESTALHAPAGVCLFRTTFDVDEDATCRVFVAFDNRGDLYIDGAEMTSFESFTVGRYIELTLSAGTHHIAARVENLPNGQTINPGGFICAVYTTGAGGLLDELLVHTDASWRHLPYPDTAPGFTHGEVLLTLIDEADEFFGTYEIPEADFTATHDSAGQPWSVYREISVQVGRSVLEVIEEMADTYIDVEMAPGSNTLRAWNFGTRGTERYDVVLTQTDDPNTSEFRDRRHRGKRARLNRALIRYAGGHIEEIDSFSAGTIGGRGGFLQMGAIKGASEAKRVSRGLMESRARDSWSTTATVLPSSDATTPGKAFWIGDSIICPDQSDTGVGMRVFAITMAENDDAIIEWPLALQDRAYVYEERVSTWLERMAQGAVMGGARVSSPAGKPDPSAQQVASLSVAEFSFDNTQLVESLSPRRPAEVSGNMVEIFAEVTTAGATDTRIQMYLNGVELGSELLLPAGVTEAETPLSIVPVRANVDKLQCEIVEAGAGAEGLDVQVRAI